MKTLDEIEAGLAPKAKAYYSSRCCWWTTDAEDLGELPDVGLPCCPYCGSPLYEGPAADFIASARANPSHYGPNGLDSLARAHHSSGLHATAWNKFKAHPIRYPRQERELSQEKSIRCVQCGSEFSEADTVQANACPKCGATGVPMAIKDDVTVRVNWHELRILGIWADNWAGVCDEREPHGGAKEVVGGILHRLQAQYPHRTPLTLFGELVQLQDEYPNMTATDANGREILSPKKPS